MRLLPFLAITFFAAGCGSGRVQVVDSMNRPIQGAQVTPVSLSMNGTTTTTSARGEASVPLHLGQGTRWVGVSHPGFQPQQVDVPKTWPLRVVLRPTTRP